MEFVRRYCHPSDGWMVFVDIDASEEGRTGGERKSNEAKERQREAQKAGIQMRDQLSSLGATVGGERAQWFRARGLPPISGDRDIVAFRKDRQVCLIAEVEGVSSGQPEQKLYKAIGQLVMASSFPSNDGWRRKLVLVVHGQTIATHLQRAAALARLSISALSLAQDPHDDRWLFGSLEDL